MITQFCEGISLWSAAGWLPSKTGPWRSLCSEAVQIGVAFPKSLLAASPRLAVRTTGQCFEMYFCKVNQDEVGAEDLQRHLGTGPGPMGCDPKAMKQVHCQEL